MWDTELFRTLVSGFKTKNHETFYIDISPKDGEAVTIFYEWVKNEKVLGKSVAILSYRESKIHLPCDLDFLEAIASDLLIRAKWIAKNREQTIRNT